MDKTIKQIADSLGLPKNTVEHHFRQIRKEDPEFGSKSAETGGSGSSGTRTAEACSENRRGRSRNNGGSGAGA